MRLLCRILEVSEAGYYQWRKRPESHRRRANRALLVHVRAVHGKSRGRYGSIRVRKELHSRGIRCGRHRVARLMREEGLRAKAARKYKPTTTDSRHRLPVAPNILERDFTAKRPNEVWVGDISFIPTRQGWLYLAVLIDLYSRRVVGWAMGETMTADLVVQALEMAQGRRKPPPGLIVHTDRGTQYASLFHQARLKAYGCIGSMSRRGDCYDNAVAESFFHSLKVELVHDADFQTRDEARRELFEYIESFYNSWRRHSHNGYRSPKEMEEKLAA